MSEMIFTCAECGSRICLPGEVYLPKCDRCNRHMYPVPRQKSYGPFCAEALKVAIEDVKREMEQTDAAALRREFDRLAERVAMLEAQLAEKHPVNPSLSAQILGRLSQLESDLHAVGQRLTENSVRIYALEKQR
jgi:hypothetical protein